MERKTDRQTETKKEAKKERESQKSCTLCCYVSDHQCLDRDKAGEKAKWPKLERNWRLTCIWTGILGKLRSYGQRDKGDRGIRTGMTDTGRLA